MLTISLAEFSIVYFLIADNALIDSYIVDKKHTIRNLYNMIIGEKYENKK